MVITRSLLIWYRWCACLLVCVCVCSGFSYLCKNVAVCDVTELIRGEVSEKTVGWKVDELKQPVLESALRGCTSTQGGIRVVCFELWMLQSQSSLKKLCDWKTYETKIVQKPDSSSTDRPASCPGGNPAIVGQMTCLHNITAAQVATPSFF